MCAKNPFLDIIPYPYDSSLGTSKTEMQYAKTYVNLDIFKFNAIFLWKYTLPVHFHNYNAAV